MPVRTFTHTATAPRDARTAWRALQTASTWEAVAGVDDVSEPRHHPDGTLAGFRFRATAGGRSFPGVASTTVTDEPERMVVTIETSELDGMIDVTLSPDGVGTTVGVSVTIRSRSMMAGLFFSTIARSVGTGLEAQVEAFARRLAV